ncbi:MAG: NADH-quinone oxidoreductase subunit K [Candidatus Dormibacteria bacterium]
MQELTLASPGGAILSLDAVLILLSALACLGSKLFDRYLTYYALQSMLLAVAAATAAYLEGDAALWVLAGLTLALKGWAIPTAARRWLVQRLELKRDSGITAGLSLTLVMATALCAFAYLAVSPERIAHGLLAASVVPISTAVVLLGALGMVVRRHMVAQLIGWLVMENGVFLGAITLAASFPLIVEVGIFFDLLAGFLIMLAMTTGLAERISPLPAGRSRQDS